MSDGHGSRPTVGEGEHFWERPTPSRVWDYLGGGKDNFAVDRVVADTLLTEFPTLAVMARATRQFVARAVHLLTTAGIDQFLDIGCGFPAGSLDTQRRAADQQACPRGVCRP